LSDILNTASTGLLAFQRAISTTSHNIANARTEGYSRQRVELQARPPDSRGIDDKPGNGTMVRSIQRQHDRFAAAAVLASASGHAREATHRDLAGRIDNLIADESLGLGPAMSDFYNAIEDAAAEPGSRAAREALLANADALSGRFGALQSELDDTRIEVNDRMRFEIDSLNDLAQGVAEINARVVASHGRGGTNGANDLLDQRDVLIGKIAEHIDVTPLEQTDGSVNLLVGNGTALVLGQDAHALRTVHDPTGPARQRLELDTGGGRRLALGATPVGGSIGGLIDFAGEVLDPVRHRVGRLALVTAAELNAQHEVGLDANGEPGAAWFTSAEPETLSSTSNTGSGTVTASVTDTSALEASDYLLRWNGASFDVTRRSDGTRTNTSAPLAIDGLEITLSGAPAVNDTFLVSATGHAAGHFDSTIDRTEELALAATLVATDALDNTGDARLAQPSVTDETDAALRDSVDIRFTSDSTFDVVDRASGVPITTDIAYVAGETITVNGWTSSLSGSPAAGDVHRVDLNTDGSGDNGNALALVASQDAMAVGGRATANDEYADLVSFVGGRKRSLDTRVAALETLRDEALARSESVSGVNLDEEAIELTRYQQAYQAAAQAISVADNLFQSILGAVAR